MPAIRPVSRQPASVALIAIELGEQLVDSPGDLIAGRAYLLDGPPLRIRQLPVDVAFARYERAGIAAAHRDDDVGLLRELGESRCGRRSERSIPSSPITSITSG